jgi:predicted aldo/keto reductase-like oxidoreductase
MKVFAQDRIPGPPPAEQLIRYSMSLPVTAVVIGMPKLEYLEQNVETARRFQPMPAAEMRKLSDHLSAQHQAALDRYFAHHVDG